MAQNMTVETKGKALIITIPDKDMVLSESGSELKQIDAKTGKPKLRANDQIATSNGFHTFERYGISLNVHRDPAVRLAAVKA